MSLIDQGTTDSCHALQRPCLIRAGWMCSPRCDWSTATEWDWDASGFRRRSLLHPDVWQLCDV